MMTDQPLPPPSLDPTITRDYVPLAVATVGFSIMLGTAIMTGCLLVNRWLIQDLAANALPDVNQPAATIVLAGALATIFVPVLVGWTLLAPIGFAYRRFGLAMVGGFAAFLLSMVSVPINEALGMPGLAGMFLLAVLGAILLFRALTRAREKA